MTFQSKRNVLCEIFDPMLAFFYRFIRPNVEPIKSGYGKAIRKEQEKTPSWNSWSTISKRNA